VSIASAAARPTVNLSPPMVQNSKKGIPNEGGTPDVHEDSDETAQRRS